MLIAEAKIEQLSVDVETKGEITKGMTVTERRRFATLRANMKVWRAADAPRFMEEFMNAVKLHAES